MNKPVRIASFLLIGVGTLLLVLNAFLGNRVNIGLPLVFLMLGGGFFILVFSLKPKWTLASILFIPGSFLLALGLIFLLNVLTGDWNAWAYAWLLLAAAVGSGLILASRDQPWPQAASLAGWGLAAAGVTLFAVFGAIAGGLFIQVMAPILLILGGLSLRWAPWQVIFSEPVLQRFHPAVTPAPDAKAPPAQPGLVEPLSARELEVLKLVSQGLSNQQIAAKLNIAPSTVKTHINNIYGKLGVETRTQAVRQAQESGLLGSTSGESPTG